MLTALVRCATSRLPRRRARSNDPQSRTRSALGLLGIDDGVAAKVLTRLGVSAPEARSEIEQIIGRGSAPPTGQPPFTPRSK